MALFVDVSLPICHLEFIDTNYIEIELFLGDVKKYFAENQTVLSNIFIVRPLFSALPNNPWVIQYKANRRFELNRSWVFLRDHTFVTFCQGFEGRYKYKITYAPFGNGMRQASRQIGSCRECIRMTLKPRKTGIIINLG